MGVPPFLVAGGLSGVVAQRLVRKRCHLCHGRGCEECREGCRGRTGVYQVLALSDALRDEITRHAGTRALRELARDAGMGTLADDARRAVATGLTTPHEAARFIRAAGEGGILCSGCGGSVPFDALACPWCGRSRRRRCACGRTLETGWRFCAWCHAEVAT